MATNNKSKKVKEERINFAKIRPEADGVDFINIHPSGTTALGKLLADTVRSEFRHPSFGAFKSVEGFRVWLQLKTKQCSIGSRARFVYGNEAVTLSHKVHNKNVPHYTARLQEAQWCKVFQNPEIRQALMESELPLVYFYVDAGFAVAPPQAGKRVKFFEKIRRHLKNGGGEDSFMEFLPITDAEINASEE